MRIAIGCDPNAAPLKTYLIPLIQKMGHEWKDFGSDDPIYAKVAIAVAEAVRDGKYDRGLLLCGTGIGMSVAANKVKGAIAALVSDVYSAKKAVRSNKANIICMGAFTTGTGLAGELLEAYLSVDYAANTPSAEKVACYESYDRNRS